MEMRMGMGMGEWDQEWECRSENKGMLMTTIAKQVNHVHVVFVAMNMI